MAMAQKLMESGALQDVISSMNKGENSADESHGENHREESKNQTPMPDLSALMNPEMMKMLPGLMGLLGQRSDSDKNEGGDDHRALLCALRPFLSENRRRAIDMMIGMEKLGILREILPKE